jgi:hypothetical protein
MACPKRGNKVTVYEDPFTRTKPEGEATVVKSLGFETQPFDGKLYRVYWCRVRFLNDDPDQLVERRIVSE